MRFRTESGAEYLFEDGYLTRTGDYSPGIDYEKVPDGHAEKVLYHTPIEVGESALFDFENGLYRLTTPVVEVLDD